MVGLSTAMIIGAMATLAVWIIAQVLRAVRRHPELDILLPTRLRA